jgi:hypothetical protein
MTHVVMSRREFAGIPVTLTTAAVPQPEPHQLRRSVALGRITRHGGQVTICDQLTGTTSTQAGR